MNTKGMVIGGVIVVLAVAAAGVYFLRDSGTGLPNYTPPAQEMPGRGVTGTAASDTDPFDVTITYTDEGYAPSDITVTKGTRVRFINASNEPTWPASGVHPTHSLYPEKESADCLGSSFDSCRPLQPGEFYDFTFYYEGRWPYHDHLAAYNSGSITVTAP